MKRRLIGVVLLVVVLGGMVFVFVTSDYDLQGLGGDWIPKPLLKGQWEDLPYTHFPILSNGIVNVIATFVAVASIAILAFVLILFGINLATNNSQKRTPKKDVRGTK